MTDATRPAPVPSPTVPSPDEWRARDRFERDLLKQVRRVDWRTGRAKQAIINWNGITVVVLVGEQVS